MVDCFVERCMDVVRDLGVLYWLFVPGYLVWGILFAKKVPDSLGLFSHVVESGVVSYD